MWPLSLQVSLICVTEQVQQKRVPDPNQQGHYRFTDFCLTGESLSN